MADRYRFRKINIFYGHIAVGVGFSLLGLWLATQYCAYALGYQPQLGHVIGTVQGHPVYQPWAWWLWAYHYEPYAPWVFVRASWITYGSFAVMSCCMIALAIRRARKEKTSGAYGTARWANNNELEQAGFFSSKGVFLGQTDDARFEQKLDTNDDVKLIQKKAGKNFIRHNGPEHVIAFAPTRSGKGVGLVVPTLLSWTESVLVYDIKKENWNITSGWRSKFSHCLCFEPTSPDSVKYNPLLEIRQGVNEVRDVQNIADILVDPEGGKERKDHWEKTGHSLLVAAILHVLYAEKEKSLNGVARFLANPERDIHQTIAVMMRTNHLETGPHPVVASSARELMNKAENELSGVVSTAMSFLGLYRDPVIARNTSSSDFSISDLLGAERPVSLYLVVPPSDAERIRPLIRLVLNQIGRRLTESVEFGEQGRPATNHKLLFMLDEFPTLGRLSFFESELAYMAGYGIKAYLIAQSLNQIEKAYGPNNSILDNCHIRITYGALDERTAQRISKLLGEKTETRRQLNLAGNRLAPWLGHIMESEQESARQLLTPGEVLQLPNDDVLIMVGGMAPYRGKKITYYQDARFAGRAFLEAPEPATELLPSRVSNWCKTLVNEDTNLPEKSGDYGQSQADGNSGGPGKNSYEKGESLDRNFHVAASAEGRKRRQFREQKIAKSVEKETLILTEKTKIGQQKAQQKDVSIGRQIEMNREENGGGLPL
ncbi:MAG: IncP-type conjugal transfer protein TraG [Desulfobulbaceae bacterium]|nr:IncP-type conjugal transfer protein TraG [Desulfobulbaceae bacterium]